jgi:hypothetical protein
MTVEVYLQNVIPWSKIMGVTPLFDGSLLPLVPDVNVVFMGKNLTSSIVDVFQEWQDVQRVIQAKL